MNLYQLKLTSLALALVVSTAPASAQKVVGVNAAIKNRVQMKTSRDASLRKAMLKERVHIGDDIVTGRNSVLQILLRDRTSFTVGQNGRVKIDRFVYDVNNNASEVAVSVAKGAFRFISGKATRNRKGRSSVRTPVGSIGIRGTIFEGAVGAAAVAIAKGENVSANAIAGANDEATLVVLRGPGKAAQNGEEPGAVDIRTEAGVFPLEQPGKAYFIPAKGSAPLAFDISLAGLAAMQQLLRTSPDQPASAIARPSIVRSPSTELIIEVSEGVQPTGP